MIFKAHIQLFVIAFCLMFTRAYAQDSLKHKPSFRIYPSLHPMYGIGFYPSTSQNYKQSQGTTYINSNFNVGLQCNASLEFKNNLNNNLHIELYVGYNRWNYADLFPVGLTIRPKLNKKKNGFYLKFAAARTFGKMYYDPNNKWPKYSAEIEPKDNGNGRFQLKTGIEKNWYITDKQSISFGFELLIQTIGTYAFRYSVGYQPPAIGESVMSYKFAGLMIAYHFD